ncbi:2-oxo-4-hydroxy-4-carboxy-5-ureidoimidazoline decarboxylase [Actinacidiphila guanduensis]|uniref:2-oxo-4-hydroxy-4-carboxy-5-ureidoimidazoline decarboxylase n=1 Tax=Actinacidiphila guanduensis TaxID=310781 RepID=A0A1H0K5T0_9ACTN|nr:2-oxo-4-hydroxy-4-carboxy-5-ureidoimidazoline decarboxylase [Actinacidiphila guanduensis]SDO51100.1 2-oxo-4-hydroxy-4-carboxy-5-ureidoimidazoline decarboxylase [Actinacidiphila guanduensis]
MTSSASPGLARLNEAADPAALLREVCASSTWCAAVAAGRPYEGVEQLLAASDAAMAALDPADLDEAMAAHPPIGRPTPGDAVSAREQSGVGDAEREELLRLNLAYQEAHGHVFLICATGRTGAQMLAALKERIGNDAPTEREIVRDELGRINRVRLTRLAERTEAP